MVDLPLSTIIFSCDDNIASMKEDKDPKDSSISHTGTIFLFLVQRIYFIAFLVKKCLFFDGSFVYWRSFKQRRTPKSFICRSSQSSRGVLQNSQACNFIKKETLAQMFSCEFFKISKNTSFYRTTPETASLFESISLF